MKTLKNVVRDTVHGHISFSDYEWRIIDTPQFQRLRWIRTNGMVFYVFPGDTHTRFEHSLGTAYLAGRIAARLGMDVDKVDKARIAGLIHDIGHSAFSHELEGVFGSHEARFEEALEGALKDILLEQYSWSEIRRMKKHPLVAGALGADRLDYLLRDSHYSGVVYGLVDVQRLIERMHWEGNLRIDEGGLLSAEALFIARYQMFKTVYLHRTVRIAACMLREAARQVDLDWRATDWEVLHAIRQTPIGERLLKRRLLKSIEWSGEPPAGLLYDPPREFKSRERIYLLDGRDLAEVSPLVRALESVSSVPGLVIGERHEIDRLKRRL